MCERKDIKQRCYAGVSDKQTLVDHLAPADLWDVICMESPCKGCNSILKVFGGDCQSKISMSMPEECMHHHDQKENRQTSLLCSGCRNPPSSMLSSKYLCVDAGEWWNIWMLQWVRPFVVCVSIYECTRVCDLECLPNHQSVHYLACQLMSTEIK